MHWTMCGEQSIHTNGMVTIRTKTTCIETMIDFRSIVQNDYQKIYEMFVVSSATRIL